MNTGIDIETIPTQNKELLDYVGRSVKPPATIKKQETLNDWYENKYSEALSEAVNKLSFDGGFNHIITLSAWVSDDLNCVFHAESVEQEGDVIQNYMDWISKNISFKGRWIGHNIIGFDLRVIKQRCMVLGIKPFSGLRFDAKPWDDNPYDTMLRWNSDRQNMTSMDKLCRIFGIEGKGDMDGSQVYQAWLDNKHAEIKDYCLDDAKKSVLIFNRMEGIYE